MADDVLKKTCLFNNSAPRRPMKLGNVQSVVSSSDYFATNNRNGKKSTNSPNIDEIVLDDDDDDDNNPKEDTKKLVKCPTCQRDMTLWSNSRRSSHSKECEELKRKKNKKLTETMMRPNKSGKVNFLDEDDDSRKFRSPKKVVFARREEKEEKKWEMTKDDVKFAKIDADDEANRRRKRPRSFAVVELAPRQCQCEILTTLHSNFMEKFRVSRKTCVEADLAERSTMIQKLIFKNSRLEQLSIDMRKMMEDGSQSGNSEPVTIKCVDGEIKCQRNILKHRTTIIPKNSASCLDSIIQVDQNREVVKNWLVFVFTAQIEWRNDQNENIRKLAESYGPADLVGLTKTIEKENDRGGGGKLEKLLEEGSTGAGVTDSGTESRSDVGGGLEEIEPGSSDPLMEGGEEENRDQEMLTNEEIETAENAEITEITEIQTTNDVFMSDDPLIGFKMTKDVEKAEKEEEVVEMEENVLFENPSTSQLLQNDTFRTPTSSSRHSRNDNSPVPEVSMDSFDLFVPEPQISSSNSNSNTEQDPKTPQNIRVFPRFDEKLKFGSNVRVLKTNDITPMADYENMDENELKERVKAIGQRPRGKKKMVEILKMAYDTTHPAINPDTPTLRPLPKSPEGRSPQRPPPKRKPLRFSPIKKVVEALVPPSEPDQEDADRTLNTSNDDLDVGRICGDDVEEEDDEEPCTSHGKGRGGKMDLGEMKTAFLEWIRLDHNVELYNHLLSLHPVSLEELLARMGKADGIVSIIGKAKLAMILDSLSISFQLPQKKGGPRKAIGRRK